MGDGVLAYFGFPRGSRRRCGAGGACGLEIAEVVAGLQTRAREKLAVRVGIATGLVVVDDLVGRGSAQEKAVVDDTPNLAAAASPRRSRRGRPVRGDAAAARRTFQSNSQNFAVTGFGVVGASGDIENVNQRL